MAGAIVLFLSIHPIAAAGEAAAPEGPDLSRRQEEILDGIAKYAPWEFPDRWLHELGSPEERDAVLRSRLLESVSWVHFLSYANVLDWSEGGRARTLEALLGRLPRVRSGKVRQNIIFLAALTAPEPEKALEGLGAREGVTEEDRLDIRTALAALGVPGAIDWLEKELPPSEAFVGKPLFTFDDYRKEDLLEAGRAEMRSYRLWEVLFRRPYFHRLKLLARAGIYPMEARGLDAERRNALVRRLIPIFLAKWPGHPGCDDAALRLMNFAIERKDPKEIAIWAQRASLLPDQDCSKTAVRILKALADSQLSPAAVDEILASPDGHQNRDFLRYQRFLLTVREDLAGGIAWFDRLAAEDPSGIFAAARQAAARIEPAKALRDGSLEDIGLQILRLYPERSRKLAETPFEAKEEAAEEDYLDVLTSREKEVVLRTRLQRSRSVDVDPGRLAKQYRHLLELKNLADLEAAATDPEVKADLRYRQAKMWYRETDLVFPVWATLDMAWGYALNSVRFDPGADRRLEAYVARTFAFRRAYDVLAAIPAAYPGYRGMPNVVFHMAQAYAKLMDDPPAKSVDVWVFPDRPPEGSREGRIEYAHRRVGELFRQVVEKYPDCEWADESEKGTAWRSKMANLLKLKREKEEAREARERQAGSGRDF